MQESNFSHQGQERDQMPTKEEQLRNAKSELLALGNKLVNEGLTMTAVEREMLHKKRERLDLLIDTLKNEIQGQSEDEFSETLQQKIPVGTVKELYDYHHLPLGVLLAQEEQVAQSLIEPKIQFDAIRNSTSSEPIDATIYRDLRTRIEETEEILGKIHTEIQRRNSGGLQEAA